jgi:hypothetical protein
MSNRQHHHAQYTCSQHMHTVVGEEAWSMRSVGVGLGSTCVTEGSERERTVWGS